MSWICLGGATVSAIAATAIYLPLGPGRNAVAARPAPADTPLAQARPSDFSRQWYDEWTQVAGRLGAPQPAPQQRLDDYSWLWAGATFGKGSRFTPRDVQVASLTVDAPLPVPRPDIIPSVRSAAANAALASVPPATSATAYAPSDEPRVASLPPRAEPSEPGLLDKLFGDPDRAAKAVLAANPNRALYDIVRQAVYLPDGTKLEAHSGFGEYMDIPESVHRKNVGVTPPNVYAVSFREKPFHGVRALRMKPIGDGNMYGRDGILAHSYLLGEAGASNGCISVKDYDAFLKAFEDGKFKEIIVMRSIEDPVPRLVASAQ